MTILLGIGVRITNPACIAIFSDHWSIVEFEYGGIIVDVEMHSRLSGRVR